MDSLFVMMYNLFLVISYIKDEFKKVTVLTWKISKWDFINSKVFVEVSFEKAEEWFAVVVMCNGIENPIQWMTDKAYGEMSYHNVSPVIKLSKEECEKRGVQYGRINKSTVTNTGWVFLDIQDRKHKRAIEERKAEEAKCNSWMEDWDI